MEHKKDILKVMQTYQLSCLPEWSSPKYVNLEGRVLLLVHISVCSLIPKTTRVGDLLIWFDLQQLRLTEL